MGNISSAFGDCEARLMSVSQLPHGAIFRYPDGGLCMKFQPNDDRWYGYVHLGTGKEVCVNGVVQYLPDAFISDLVVS